MTLGAYITDAFAIRRILEHLGLAPRPEEKPPPVREVRLIPVDEEGREIVR
jgi:hypothetical protein